MAEITRILTVTTHRQFFFVITTTRCFVKNFQLICYSQRVNASSQYDYGSSSSFSKWPNDWMVAVVKHCWLSVQGRGGCREKMTTEYCWIGAVENIGTFRKSLNDRNSFIYLSLFERQVGPMCIKLSYPRDDWKMFWEHACTG